MKLTTIKPAFTDERGAISDIFYKKDINHIAIITSKKGAVRGNHYHKQSTQHMYMIKGSLNYYYKDLGSDELKSVIVKQGEMVTSGINEIHAMEMLEDNEAMVFSEGLRGGEDYEKDTFRVDSLIIKNH